MDHFTMEETMTNPFQDFCITDDYTIRVHIQGTVLWSIDILFTRDNVNTACCWHSLGKETASGSSSYTRFCVDETGLRRGLQDAKKWVDNRTTAKNTVIKIAKALKIIQPGTSGGGGPGSGVL